MKTIPQNTLVILSELCVKSCASAVKRRDNREGRREEMITIEQNTQMILSELSERLRVSAVKEYQKC